MDVARAIRGRGCVLQVGSEATDVQTDKGGTELRSYADWYELTENVFSPGDVHTFWQQQGGLQGGVEEWWTNSALWRFPVQAHPAVRLVQPCPLSVQAPRGRIRTLSRAAVTLTPAPRLAPPWWPPSTSLP